MEDVSAKSNAASKDVQELRAMVKEMQKTLEEERRCRLQEKQRLLLELKKTKELLEKDSDDEKDDEQKDDEQKEGGNETDESDSSEKEVLQLRDTIREMQEKLEEERSRRAREEQLLTLAVKNTIMLKEKQKKEKGEAKKRQDIEPINVVSERTRERNELFDARPDKLSKSELEYEMKERAERKHNIIVRGVRNMGRNTKFELCDLLEAKLMMPVKIIDVKPLGGGLLVTTSSLKHKIEIMSKKSILRGTDIFIDDDLTEREKVVQKWLEKLHELKLKEGCRVQLGHAKITINGAVFLWDEREGDLIQIRKRTYNSSTPHDDQGDFKRGRKSSEDND